METCIDYTGDTAYVSTDERRIVNRILRLKQENDGKVEVIKYPGENHNTLYCKIPSEWVRIAPKRKREYSDDELEKIKNRLENARNSKQTENDGDDGDGEY